MTAIATGWMQGTAQIIYYEKTMALLQEFRKNIQNFFQPNSISTREASLENQSYYQAQWIDPNKVFHR